MQANYGAFQSVLEAIAGAVPRSARRVVELHAGMTCGGAAYTHIRIDLSWSCIYAYTHRRVVELHAGMTCGGAAYTHAYTHRRVVELHIRIYAYTCRGAAYTHMHIDVWWSCIYAYTHRRVVELHIRIDA